MNISWQLSDAESFEIWNFHQHIMAIAWNLSAHPNPTRLFSPKDVAYNRYSDIQKNLFSLCFIWRGVWRANLCRTMWLQVNNKLTFKNSLIEPKYDIHRKFNKLFEFHSFSKLCYASLIVITGYQGEARTICGRRLRVRKVSATDGYASPIQRTDHRSRSFWWWNQSWSRHFYVWGKFVLSHSLFGIYFLAVELTDSNVNSLLSISNWILTGKSR